MSDSRNVAVLLYPGCIYAEIEVTVLALSGQFEVVHFSPDGLDLIDSKGKQLPVQGSYADLESADVKCVLIPGGDPGSIIPEQKATAALQQAAGQGALMAGICAGNLVLASAGLLKGFRATHNYTLEYAPIQKVTATAGYWDGILFERSDLVEDGNRITAQPWAYEHFASVIAKRLCKERDVGQ